MDILLASGSAKEDSDPDSFLLAFLRLGQDLTVICFVGDPRIKGYARHTSPLETAK